MDLPTFLTIYRYGKKPSTMTGWLLIDRSHPVGDCEDFALTCAYIKAGHSWWRLTRYLYSGKIRFVFVDSLGTTSQKPRHTIMRWRRADGTYRWFDSNYPGKRIIGREIWSYNRKVWIWPATTVLGFIEWGRAYKAIYGNTSEER